MDVDEDRDKVRELKKAGSPQSLAMVELLRRKEAYAGRVVTGTIPSNSGCDSCPEFTHLVVGTHCDDIQSTMANSK